MDWNAIQQYLPLYQKAAVLTVRLGVAGIIFAIIIGLACAVIQYDKVPVLRQIVGVYIQLSRNTPLLVQLFFIYYGLPESAYSLGMNRWQTMRYIILPQAMSTSMPAFMANVIFLLKETSVFSAISLMDLMFTAKDLIGMYSKTIECLFLLVVFYLIILLPVSIVGSLIERRLRYAGFGS